MPAPAPPADPAPKRLLDELYPECQHPGCDARTFLQYDHVVPYGQGGSTVVVNLRRLCGTHNRARQAGRP